MSTNVFDRLSELLTRSGVSFEVLRHGPVYTSEEAAEVRGSSLASGAKALICKADGRFVMIVLPADRRLASKQVRKTESLRSLRFATQEEVAQSTTLSPGSIPPFGSLFELPTWCDRQLAEQPTINFNAGDHSISIKMEYSEYARIEQPRLGDFAS